MHQHASPRATPLLSEVTSIYLRLIKDWINRDVDYPAFITDASNSTVSSQVNYLPNSLVLDYQPQQFQLPPSTRRPATAISATIVYPSTSHNDFSYHGLPDAQPQQIQQPSSTQRPTTTISATTVYLTISHNDSRNYHQPDDHLYRLQLLESTQRPATSSLATPSAYTEPIWPSALLRCSIHDPTPS